MAVFELPLSSQEGRMFPLLSCQLAFDSVEEKWEEPSVFGLIVIKSWKSRGVEVVWIFVKVVGTKATG
ncbi:MAG: hypothetical protein ACREB9_07115, partial [Thermoplasmata archaeon]